MTTIGGSGAPAHRDDPLLSTGDIAARLGVTRQWAVKKAVNRDDFPAPAQQTGRTRLWRAADVETWIAEHRPDADREPEPRPLGDRP